MTIAEAASIRGCSENTIWKAVSTGKLAGHKEDTGFAHGVWNVTASEDEIRALHLSERHQAIGAAPKRPRGQRTVGTKDLYTVAEIMKMTGASKTTVNNAARQLKAQRLTGVGRGFLIPRADVLRIVKALERPAPKPKPVAVPASGTDRGARDLLKSIIREILAERP